MISGVSGDDFLAGARTISGEADNQPYEGKVAIAYVLINRLIVARDYKVRHGKDHPNFGDGSLYRVCLDPNDFSCWNEGDPNRSRILELVVPSAFALPAFRDSVEALASVIAGRAGANPASQGTHYCVVGRDPYWAKGLTPLCTIGAHVFYIAH